MPVRAANSRPKHRAIRVKGRFSWGRVVVGAAQQHDEERSANRSIAKRARFWKVWSLLVT